jgi:hypothetical protein
MGTVIPAHTFSVDTKIALYGSTHVIDFAGGKREALLRDRASSGLSRTTA